MPISVVMTEALCPICGNVEDWYGFSRVTERSPGEWIVKCERCELYSVQTIEKTELEESNVD